MLDIKEIERRFENGDDIELECIDREWSLERLIF